MSFPAVLPGQSRRNGAIVLVVGTREIDPSEADIRFFVLVDQAGKNGKTGIEIVVLGLPRLVIALARQAGYCPVGPAPSERLFATRRRPDCPELPRSATSRKGLARGGRLLDARRRGGAEW